MRIIELFLVAVGLSMDAFAVAICKGLSMEKASVKNMLIVGFYFGVFQMSMPLLGYVLGAQFAGYIEAYDHWIAFVLLAIIGIQMLRESMSGDNDCTEAGGVIEAGGCVECGPAQSGISLAPAEMLPLAVATSIDALAVGVSFAFLGVDILPAVSFIGIVTFALSAVGVQVGNLFGARYKSRAEMAGGIILILIGLKILLEHLGIRF